MKLGFTEQAQEFIRWKKEFQVEKTLCVEKQNEKSQYGKAIQVKKLFWHLLHLATGIV